MRHDQRAHRADCRGRNAHPKRYPNTRSPCSNDRRGVQERLASRGSNYGRSLWDQSRLGDARGLRFREHLGKAASYKPTEYALNLTGKQVLNAVDRLDKRIPGTRVAYDVLCEFLHPNVGDLLASTLDSEAFLDRLGIRHLEFTIGRGPANLQRRPDIAPVLASVIRIATNIITLIPIIYKQLDKLGEIITSRTTKAMRPLLKKNMHFFRRSDLCPCHSGKTIGACCLKQRES
jgi:hypothetical protein